MEKLFALAIVITIVAFAVVYTVAALTGPSKLLK
jgi:heme/copper-type cytochrome/quinol oxidase subunit 4